MAAEQINQTSILEAIGVCIWNLNGFKDAKVQNIKDTNDGFLNEIFRKNDIICFSETWRDPKDSVKLNIDENFEDFHELGFRNHRVGRASGGLSLFIRKSVASHVIILASDSYHFWCKLDRKFFQWDMDLFICFLYIPPSTSTLFKSGVSLNFESLHAECASFAEKGCVLILGDTNARTNDVNDFIENDELDDYLPVDDQYVPDLALDKRINSDNSPLNTNGSAMIDFCKNTGFRILNGRVDKNKSSGFTRFSSNGNSVVDYALMKQDFFNLIKSFRVNEVSELSDHCSLEIEIKTQFQITGKGSTRISEIVNNPPSNTDILKNNFKHKFYVGDSTIRNLCTLINNREIAEFLNKTNDQLGNKDMPVHLIVNSLRCKLIEISEQCFETKNIFSKKKINVKCNNAWFDSECKSKKQNLSHARKLYQESLKMVKNNLSNIIPCELRSAYFQQRREYKKLLKNKRKLFLDVQKEQLWLLKAESPKMFWKKLNKGRKPANLDFTNLQLFDYFNSLLEKQSSVSGNNQEINQHQTSLDTLTLSQIDANLNCPITIEEVTNMVGNLKTGKSPGLDMISAELIRNLNSKFYLVFVHLFNRILESGDFPEEWASGIIVLLFKGGDQSNLDNYRGITLLSIFGKLFIGTLLQRLNKTISTFQILNENQIAYRKGYQTSDHIFTLRAIIEHYFEVKKSPLYLCFVDFSKAFDSVDHEDLVKQLFKYGIRGNFLSIIASLYSKVKSCVRGNNELTNI